VEYVEGEIARPGDAVAARRSATVTGHGHGGEQGELDAAHAVAALYEDHALALIRLAYIMLGDQYAAEDVVQDAFSGLYRAWHRLPDSANLLGYLRVSVVNGCRSVYRRARRVPVLAEPDAASAESVVLAGEEQRATVAALKRLLPRQREAIVLRYYAGLPEQEVAQAMGISRGTVKSNTSRGLATLGRILREES
jgi:RNA polymerase sigma-70 factor (sigma-E family)